MRQLRRDYGKMTLALPGATPVTHSLARLLSQSASQPVIQSVSVCLRLRGFQAVGVGSGGTRLRRVHVLRTPTYGTTVIRLPSAEFAATSAPPSPFSSDIIFILSPLFRQGK